jgi:hypothetical protein
MNSFGVAVPPLFWSDLKVPKQFGNDFSQQVQAFHTSLAELRKQEASGLVDRNIVVRLLLATWSLRNSALLTHNQELHYQVLAVRDIAVKYGLGKLWRSRYHSQLVDRANAACVSGGSRSSVYHCGVCGRTIWNPLSVSRGVGPICFGKLGR